MQHQQYRQQQRQYLPRLNHFAKQYPSYLQINENLIPLKPLRRHLQQYHPQLRLQ